MALGDVGDERPAAVGTGIDDAMPLDYRQAQPLTDGGVDRVIAVVQDPPEHSVVYPVLGSQVPVGGRIWPPHHQGQMGTQGGNVGIGGHNDLPGPSAPDVARYSRDRAG